jgi:16S rRNA C967 or C1407 C5-methylase (RsmB/RsmF family)
VGDAREPAAWWDGKPFDRILVDAPCSGTGVIRRHPDIKVLRRPEDIGRMAAVQADLLRGAWTMLAPGGRLVYATCSVLSAETVVSLPGKRKPREKPSFCLHSSRVCRRLPRTRRAKARVRAFESGLEKRAWTASIMLASKNSEH